MTTLAINPITGSIDTGDAPRSGLMTFTPEVARTILEERNTTNRTISALHVDRLARDMKAGRFINNGDSIRFATDGTLLDGQHRLAAIVRSGVTLRLFVVWGLPLEAQATMDDGRRRTMHDVLVLEGATLHAKTTASILRRVIMLERGSLTNTSLAPTKGEMKAYLEAHPQVVDAAAVAEQVRNAKGIRCAASTLGLAYYLFAEINRDMADMFFQQLRTGAGLEEGSPILVLRNRLSLDGSTRLSTESPEVVAWFIKAWNAWRDGKQMKILRHKAGDTWPVAR